MSISEFESYGTVFDILNRFRFRIWFNWEEKLRVINLFKRCAQVRLALPVIMRCSYMHCVKQDARVSALNEYSRIELDQSVLHTKFAECQSIGLVECRLTVVSSTLKVWIMPSFMMHVLHYDKV